MGIHRMQFADMLCLHAYYGSSSCLVFVCLSDHSSSLHFYQGADILRPVEESPDSCEALRRHIFALGLVYDPCAALVQATQTLVSLPGKFSMMCFTKNLSHLLMESTFSSTRSPACMLQVSLVHLLPVRPILEEMGLQVPSPADCLK